MSRSRSTAKRFPDDEWEQLLAAGDGLVRLKGRWVEVDREKLDSVLAHWKKVQRAAAGDGISFLEGMRLLAGAEVEGKGQSAMPASAADWSTVVAGDWLQNVLEELRQPHGDARPRRRSSRPGCGPIRKTACTGCGG